MVLMLDSTQGHDAHVLSEKGQFDYIKSFAYLYSIESVRSRFARVPMRSLINIFVEKNKSARPLS